jgi:hypothetical protein
MGNIIALLVFAASTFRRAFSSSPQLVKNSFGRQHNVCVIGGGPCGLAAGGSSCILSTNFKCLGGLQSGGTVELCVRPATSGIAFVLYK